MVEWSIETVSVKPSALATSAGVADALAVASELGEAFDAVTVGLSRLGMPEARASSRLPRAGQQQS